MSNILSIDIETEIQQQTLVGGKIPHVDYFWRHHMGWRDG